MKFDYERGTGLDSLQREKFIAAHELALIANKAFDRREVAASRLAMVGEHGHELDREVTEVVFCKADSDFETYQKAGEILLPPMIDFLHIKTDRKN